MKKKCFAVLLAAVMMLTVLPAAFAADAEPGVTLNVKDEGALLFGEKAFTLRDWNSSTPSDDWTDADWDAYLENPDNYPDPYTSTLIRTETREITRSDCFELPLGVTLTINAYSSSAGEENYDPMFAITCYYIRIAAWSDPDGDGVFDRRVAINWEYGHEIDDYLLPAPTEGPVEAFMPAAWFAFYDDAPNPDYSSPRLIPSVGDLWAMPATLRITSDYLTKVFGSDTFLEIAVAVGEGEDEWTPEYGYYHYLLTGKNEPGPRGETATSAGSFADVPAGEWYAGAVDWAVESGITNGTGDGSDGQPRTFSPAQTCTQAQILTFLYRAARGEGPAAAGDMDKAVAWAREKGMIGDAFDGDTPCTRATAMSYIWQAFGSPGTDPADFSDVDAGADHAAAVAWAVKNGVTNGTNDGSDGRPKTFGPDETCTRGHIVTFLHRAYVEEARLK